jgi:hypothetical protein
MCQVSWRARIWKGESERSRERGECLLMRLCTFRLARRGDWEGESSLVREGGSWKRDTISGEGRIGLKEWESWVEGGGGSCRLGLRFRSSRSE